ncbi:hypothetical protein N5C72_18590 [Achromobacter mucicolens]|uniref:Nucleotidyltransferase n=1 Tax=Achromobacter mucicolens TaxID=1389922 RepID=A0ABD4YY48_9BURK|nr:hypothetical protein [Achromobacter mucicolens]MDH1180098.1 hypothetical protein [Achromobacter mucicolens]
MGPHPVNGLLSLAQLVSPPRPTAPVGLGLPASLLSSVPQRAPSTALVELVRGLGVESAPTGPVWGFVRERFRRFLDNLDLTSQQVEDGLVKQRGVISCLNTAYYGHNSENRNAFLIGSWAKGTRIRPPRDVDLYFLLPAEVFYRFQNYGNNGQSALLQEVRSRLQARYPGSSIRGDGPVVLAAFHSYSVEVVPAFALTQANAYWVCDTKNGGSYKKTMPLHEVSAIEAADARNAGNVRRLVRMLKAWQAWCSVPIKSFYLELLAIDFLDQCAWRHQGYFYYDWICRDFFQWMISRANSFVIAPGTREFMWIGDAWKSRSESAYARALKACDLEYGNKMTEAGGEWQKIFGLDIPRIV